MQDLRETACVTAPGQARGTATGPEPRYEELRQAGIEAFHQGRLEDSRALLARALEQAEGLENGELVDRAFCNLASLDVLLGDLDGPLPRLRAILMSHRSREGSFLAASNISTAYLYRKEHKKGLFYARLALDHATLLEDRDWLATAHNQIANFFAAESQFREAIDHYEKALELSPEGGVPRLVPYRANLGYCRVTVGDLRVGLEHLYWCLRQARRAKARRLEAIARIDLCFAHLESGRLDLAWSHGARGLELAEEVGDADWIKNGLYMLGEAAVLSGRSDRGHEIFADLQRRFYPSQPFIADFLVAVDVRRLVNLRA